MQDRFPFMRVYMEVADGLKSKDDKADFYDALMHYALDDEEPERGTTGAACFMAVKRMIDKWKQTSAAGKARAEKAVSAGRSLDGRWSVAGSEKPATLQQKNKSIKDKDKDKETISPNGDIEKKEKKTGSDKPTCTANAVRPQDVIDLYNDICISMPKAIKLSEQRKRQIHARLLENEPETFRTVFEKAEASDFLAGRAKDFRADLDWILKPTSWMHILEGRYDNRDTQTDRAQVMADAITAGIDPENEREFRRVFNE